VRQQLAEQLVAVEEPEQVEGAVLGRVAGGLLLRVDPVDGLLERGPVVRVCCAGKTPFGRRSTAIGGSARYGGGSLRQAM
jgi:hypothetical protein